MAKQSLMSRVKAICTSAKNEPKQGVKVTFESINQMLEHHNSDPIAYLIGHHPKGSLVKAILAETVVGVDVVTTSKEAKAHVNKCIIVQTKSKGPSNRYSTLQQMVEDGGTWTDARKEFKPSTPRIFDPYEDLEKLIDKMADNGFEELAHYLEQVVDVDALRAAKIAKAA